MGHPANKVLSVVVSFLMAICCCPVTALAEDAGSVSDVPATSGIATGADTSEGGDITATLPVVEDPSSQGSQASVSASEGGGSTSTTASEQTSDQSAVTSGDGTATSPGPSEMTQPQDSQSGMTPEAVESSTQTDPTDIANGRCGSCSWNITSVGALVIAPTSGASGTLYGIATDGSYSLAPWYQYASSITSVKVSAGVVAGPSAALFYGCSNLTTADLSGLDVSGATSLADMFHGCSKLTAIDLSGFNTAGVTDMSSMFYGCSALLSLDLSKISTASATSMTSMFDGCTALASVTVGSDFSFKGNGSSTLATLPTPTFTGAAGTWFSWTAGSAISAADIAGSRSGLADTYIALRDDLTFSPIADQPYTGSEVTPTVTVSLGTTVLTDYTLGYWNDIDVGTATVAIKDITGYAGCATTTFRIARSLAQAKVSPISTQLYVGSAITPALTVSYADTGESLAIGKDYTVTYQDAGGNAVTAPVAVGTYTVTLTGMGSYIGTTTTEFKVCYPIADAVVADVADQSYTGSAIRPALSVTYNKTPLTVGVDYGVTYQDAGGNDVTDPTSIGTYTATIKGIDSYTGTTTKTFKIVAADISSATIAPIPVQAYSGDAITPALTVTYGKTTLAASTDYTVTYKDASGSVIASPTAVGTYTAIVTGKGGYTGTVSASATFTIAYPLSEATVSDIGAQPYTGSAIKPVPTVKYKAVGLVAGTDFTVAYMDESGAAVTSPTECGIYKVILTGKGSCVGTTSAEFSIAYSLAQAKISPVADQPYIGSAITPVLTVTYGQTTLVAGTDYTVAYTDAQGKAITAPVDLGSYTITVTGIGEYIGTNSTTFSILRSLSQATIASVPDQTYTGSAIIPSLSVTCDGASLVAGTDYVASYRDSQGTAVAAPNAAGTYTVSISGAGSYIGVANATATFTVDPASITGATIDAIPDQVYTGQAIAPALTVKLGNRTLAADTDYTVSYKDSKNAEVVSPTAQGTYTVSVTGKGNYKDSAAQTASFDIVVIDITRATVDAVPDQPYTASAIAPALTVKLGGKTLVSGTDYTVAYADASGKAVVAPTAVGTYTVKITGKTGYMGTVSQSVSFKVRYSLKQAKMADIAIQKYTGSAITPALVVEYGAHALSASSDYTVSYRDATDAAIAAPSAVGTYTVTVTGKGDYMDSASASMRVAYSLEDAAIDAISDQIYTGSAISPALDVTYGQTALAVGTDYSVSYKDSQGNVIAAPVEPGDYTAIVAGKGDYFDTKGASFKIVPADITRATVDAVPDQPYTASAIAPALTVKLGGKTLVSGTDYTVAYADASGKAVVAPTAVGTYTVKITGKTGYTGTVSQSVSFKIRYSLGKATIDDVPTQVYTGSAIAPSLTVRYGGKVLDPADDYVVSYKDATGSVVVAPSGIGTYTVTVTGKGNYMDSISTKFSIATSIEKATVAAVPDQLYTGSAITPALTVTLGGKTLIAGTDYTVSYRNASGNIVVPLVVGVYSVSISGAGSYTGKVSQAVSFKIRRSIASATVTMTDVERDFTGDVLEPSLNVNLAGITLKSGVDYTVAYTYLPSNVVMDAPIATGTYKVAIVGAGDYSGNKSVDGTFTIYSAGDVSADKPYIVHLAAGDSLVLDVSGGVFAAGTNIATWTMNGGKNQQFVFKLGDDGFYTIACADGSKLVLDANMYVVSGSNVSLWSANGGKNQKWILVPDKNGYRIESAYNPALCLGAADAAPQAGSNVQLSTASTSASNQHWELATVGSIGNTTMTVYGMVKNYTGGKLAPSITLLASGETLKAGTDYRVLYDGSTTAPSAAGSYDVTIEGLGDYSGTRDIGKFTIYDASDMIMTSVPYTLKSAANDKLVLDAAGNPALSGSNISVWSANGGANQVFTFTLGEDGFYTLVSYSDPTLVLDAAGAASLLGSNVSVWKSNGGMNQKWVVEPDGSGKCQILSAYDPAYVLDADGYVPQVGSNVTVWSANGGPNQKWVPIALNDIAQAIVTTTGMVRNATGKSLAPSVTVCIAGGTLSAGVDYKVLYNGSENLPSAAGTYKITIVGIGKYTGTKDIDTVYRLYDVSASIREGKPYRISPTTNSSVVLDVTGYTPVVGANVTTWVSNGGANQAFTLELGDDGYYTIRSAANALFILDANGGVLVAGSNVSVWTDNGGLNQRWIIEPVDNETFKIVSACQQDDGSHLILSPAKVTPSSSTNVAVYTDSDKYGVWSFTIAK